MNNLEILRKQLGKSASQVANELMVKYTTYYSWENSVTEPSIENLIKLADYFGVSIDYLVGREFKNDIGYITNSQYKTISKYMSLSENGQTKVSGYVDSISEIDEKF